MTTDEPEHGLTQEQLELVEQVLHAAIDLTGAERDERLADMCAGDTAVLNEARSLLDGVDDVESHGFLESSVCLPELEDAERYPTGDESKPSKPSRRSAGGATSGMQVRADGAEKSTSWGDCRRGDVIGCYIIRAPIGEGGFAHVYLAEQTEPIRMRVALKILKPGMDTHQLIKRFEAERQALALMDHPHVAHVYNAGATEAGRPYFVMEHVAGAAITDYCDRHRLNVQQRLELFMQACEAVHHAHQKGIIHRDIKPSNVMVSLKDGAPSVKVIDFGVAKAINKEISEQTIYTEHGQLIGTPEYMSPEQAEMSDLDIDTRADIYSLGVLLYELLAGALPFDKKQLRRGSFTKIQQIIREVEPPKPSSRLTTLGARCGEIAKSRSTDNRALHRRLRGDLDWITMKAMEKDRIRRYASASEFAADIRRHLSHEPVLAGPPSTAYKVSKFVKKHRGQVAAAAAIVVVVTAGLVASLVLSAQLAIKAFSLNESPIGLLILNEQGKCEYVNDMMHEITDVPRHKLLEQIVYELPPWREAGMDTMAKNAFRTGLEQKGSFADKSTGGQLFSFDARFVLYQSPAGQRVLMTMQDNDYKQRYNHLIEAIPQAVVEFDPGTLALVKANGSARDLFGIDRTEETFVNRPVTDWCAKPQEMKQKISGLFTEKYDPAPLPVFWTELKRDDETFMVRLQKIIKPEGVTIQGVIVPDADMTDNGDP